MGGSNSRIATKLNRSGTAAQKRAVRAVFNFNTGTFKRNASAGQIASVKNAFKTVRANQASNTAAKKAAAAKKKPAKKVAPAKKAAAKKAAPAKKAAAKKAASKK